MADKENDSSPVDEQAEVAEKEVKVVAEDKRPLLSETDAGDQDGSKAANERFERPREIDVDRLCSEEKERAKADLEETSKDERSSDDDKKRKEDDTTNTVSDGSKKEEAESGHMTSKDITKSDTAAERDTNEKSESVKPDEDVESEPCDPCPRDIDREEIRRTYEPTPRPKLLATPSPCTKLPPGAAFFKEVSREAILKIEYEDPFESMKFFHLIGVEKRPLTLADVPVEYRPYKGCIFDALSSPDDAQRLADFKKFFSELATEGHPSRTCGLMYTIMHIWRTIYRLALSIPSSSADQATYHYFVKAGMYSGLIRILGYCLDKKFMAIEYNRYVPYRIFELFFAASQSELESHSLMVEKLIEEEETVLSTFTAIATGAISCVEELGCCQVIGNMSCFTPGVLWLIKHPKLVGIVGKHLWCSYDIMYLKFRQCEDRRIAYHKHLSYTEIRIGGPHEDDSEYKPTPIRIADLTTFVALCCLVNVCAAHPDDTTMERIEPSLLEVVKQGLYWNMGNVSYGILLNDSKYTTDLTIDKFLSFLSWSCFQEETQKILIKQIEDLVIAQDDSPLLYFSRTSMSRSRSVVAFLITHALWLDYDRGSHYSILGLISLLQENVEYAMKVIELVGDMLFDLAHSFHHVRMPCNPSPLSVKRVIFETFLKFGGYRYFNEQGDPSRSFHTTYRYNKHPQCVKDVRVFSERYIEEIQLEQVEKEKLVRAADAFKNEGNTFFSRGQHESAITCYTKALDTCPLSCTERRVTYHSNRAECYIKTNRLVKAVRDCNKALAMNPRNLKARWRRAQALQSLNKDYPAALDLLTIRQREVEAKQILGEKLYWELDDMIYKLMDSGTFLELTAKKNGPTIYQGMITRDYATCVDAVSDKSTLPPFRGKHYHDIFGLGRGNYTD